jgi:L-lysine 6-transaminase
MVRCRKVLEVIESDGLVARAASVGGHLLTLLRGLGERHETVTDVRGRGLMCAFSLPDRGMRDAVLAELRDDERVLLLGCGKRSIRFRPALTIGLEELDAGVAAVDRVLGRFGNTVLEAAP